MLATLDVPIIGTRQQRINQEKSTESQLLQVRPKSVRIERNDHNHADSATLVLDWSEAGVDPRLLDNAVVQIFLDNADADGFWYPTEANCRFIGLTKDISASRDTESTAEVTIECLDYTTLFLEAKPFGSSGVPKYSMRLDEAWRTIVSQTPGADMLANKLVLQGLATFPDLGKAVSDRFARLAYVPTKPETDAWAVWQQCVGMCGLISYIDGDRCIVTTATNYYTERDSPVLIWGNNITEWGETRHSSFVKKGIGLTSFDPIAQTTVEAYWPPIGDARVKVKRGRQSKKALSTEKLRSREERDWFAYGSVHTEDQLTEVAKRVYEERSRQELEGHVSTVHMMIQTESGADFDLLDLRAGDSVIVSVDPVDKQKLAAIPNRQEQIEYLTDRGYDEDMAQLILGNLANLGLLASKFLTKSVTLECAPSDDGDGGTFEIGIDYINRIQIDGSAVA
jgi:hypothetical protein